MGAGKRKILRRRDIEKFKRPGYKIAQHTRREDSMLGSRIGTLILLWVAGLPSVHPATCPALEMTSWEDGAEGWMA